MKWLLLITVVLIALALLFSPWSDRCVRHEEINIKTGQARITLCSNVGNKSSETIEETALSRLIHGEVDAAPVEGWHPVNSFSRSGRYSPHYQFHAALHQVQLVERLLELVDWDKTRKRKVAERVLTLWQEEGDDQTAEEFLQGLLLEAMEEADRMNKAKPR